ncbi:MAG: ABC transporter ATP-binding protein [Chloroflexota bacterium]|nr:ABC transporter ATP-binding protein [Chloroflexota bacterium]
MSAREAVASDEIPIRTRGLTKRYGELVAVDRLDLDVRPGEIFGLLGQNGAGKTTTILMLLGLTDPTAGEARVLGLDPARHPLEVKRRIGYLPDSVGFYGAMTGRENLRYTARLNGLTGPLAEDRIDQVLHQVGLTDRADTRTDTYSRGMLQRLGIADALVKDPEILILDEPTAAIDPLGVVEVLDLMRRLVDEEGISILLSSHLLTQVQSVCDRIGIFAAGRLIGRGAVSQLAQTFGEDAARIEVGLELSDDAGVERGRAVLGSIPEVISVDFDSDTRLWSLRVRPPEAETRVRHAIVAKVAEAGLLLTSLRPIVPSLDEIYRRAVERAGLTAAVGQAKEERGEAGLETQLAHVAAPAVFRSRLPRKGARRTRR